MKRVPSENRGPDKESLSKWELSREASDGAPSEDWRPWLGRYPEERASGGRQWKGDPVRGLSGSGMIRVSTWGEDLVGGG